MCRQGRIAPVSKTVMSTERLGVLWLPTITNYLTVAFLPSLSCTQHLWMLPVFLLGVCIGLDGIARTPLPALLVGVWSCGQQQVAHYTTLTWCRAAFLWNAHVSPWGACLAIQCQVMTLVWCLFGLISLPWKQVALGWQRGYVTRKCQTWCGYVALEAQPSVLRAVLGVCPAVHSRHLLLGMEAGWNRLVLAWWREWNHPNQLHSTWLDLCEEEVKARMSNLASLGSWVMEKYICLWWPRT